jgi:hypothetical protein
MQLKSAAQLDRVEGQKENEQGVNGTHRAVFFLKLLKCRTVRRKSTTFCTNRQMKRNRA